ncbi:MAG: Ni/Fe-hydrogenase cytochrome b subunit [Rhodospirillales bacterium]|nr:Ni/Fe-hydrogenase cytochrome b subunit [Rhodospirillales bacterium]
MSTHEHAPIGGRLFTRWFLFLLAIVLIAGVVLGERFIFGLGAATNLNDGYPWGIWIAIDLIIGTALGCGGFVTAFLVYILNKGVYHPLARAGLMTSLFGYSLGGLAVMFDLGRWWQGYNIMLPWLINPNSVLVETALCIFAYTMVLMVEFAPTVLERFRMTRSRKTLHRVLFFFTGLGCLLPMMHQSSMGTAIVLLGYKLSPLWQSQMLTVFFLLTAVSIGFAVVVFESALSSVVFDRPFETRILAGLCGVMAWVAVIFLALRGIDLVRLGAIGLAFDATTPAASFWVETGLGVAAVALLMPVRNRSNPRTIFLGATALLLHGALYRLNCYLIGYDPGYGWHYFPSAGEILVTLGVFSLHVLLYLALVRHLPVLHAVERSTDAGRSTGSPGRLAIDQSR